MRSDYEDFSQRFNQALRERRGAVSGGQPEQNPVHYEFNAMIRGELQRRGVEPENPSRGEEGE